MERDFSAAVEVAEAVVGASGAGREHSGGSRGQARRLDVHVSPRRSRAFRLLIPNFMPCCNRKRH